MVALISAARAVLCTLPVYMRKWVSPIFRNKKLTRFRRQTDSAGPPPRSRPRVWGSAPDVSPPSPSPRPPATQSTSSPGSSTLIHSLPNSDCSPGTWPLVIAIYCVVYPFCSVALEVIVVLCRKVSFMCPQLWVVLVYFYSFVYSELDLYIPTQMIFYSKEHELYVS